MPDMQSPIAFLRSQFFSIPPYPTKKYTGQTIIVTGSNAGLGLEASRHFVRLDAAKVILAVRNLEKGEAAKRSIEEATGRTGVVQVWQLDLAHYESVKHFAKRAQGLERLDILVENAGIVTFNFSIMEDNESSITTNVVSPILHSLLLLPKLRETGAKFNTLPRLVFVTSFVHWMTQFPEREEEKIFEALADEKKARMDDRYNLSKLLEMYAVQEIAEQITASPKKGKVVVNHSNPGWVITEVMREWTGLKLFIFKIFRTIFARSTEVGSRTTVNAAEGGEETHGQFLDDCTIGERSPLLQDKEVQKRVWSELAEKLENIQPGILQNL
ncbi:hypothetical protein HO133_001385 [Letharia lupina]|uniref:NAD(P)-binding protein n=1 Tax=Letharia lupina TaxID=560253 RepID=A0A8H6CF34_9LECA|nr:uncharacterized protein HO133_001385 [Letharia lupina]KAF6222299.1 hypothetical protein HO133_001385 [Letharia lupina]